MTDEAQQSREQDEKALEDLLNANAQLYDQIDELKKKYKEYVEPAEHNRLLDHLKEQEDLNDKRLQEKNEAMKKYDAFQKDKDTAQEELVKARLEKQMAHVELNKASQQLQA